MYDLMWLGMSFVTLAVLTGWIWGNENDKSFRARLMLALWGIALMIWGK